jgi:N-acetylmuramoyl-L-alanine amidase
VVVLDPAHGGPDPGARLGPQLLEKDITLAIAARLRTSLAASGFTVVSTREADSLTPLTTEQRAEIANRTRAIACIVIHATATGTGVHLYASPLQPKEPPAAGEPSPKYRPPFEPTPWETAQAEAIPQSLQLLGDLSATLKTTGIPVITGRAPLRPLDNMVCPAVAVELAPLIVPGANSTPVTDPAYQQRVADTIARGLQYWRSQLPPPHTPAATGGNQ